MMSIHQLSDVMHANISAVLLAFLYPNKMTALKVCCSSRHYTTFKEGRKGEVGHSDNTLLSEKQKLSPCDCVKWTFLATEAEKVNT